MADTKREIERKYESDESGLPDLTGVAGVTTVVDKGVAELDAVYYDTPDERLASAGITLRRRTGGDDAGWHLKFPVSSGVRDEIREPLSDAVPSALAGLLRSRVRDTDLVPLVRIRSSRDVRDLLDADGALLAEVGVDAVHAERLIGVPLGTQWSEIEVELADGGDPAFLDKVDKKLRKAGVRASAAPSKLARALRETTPREADAAKSEPDKKAKGAKEPKGAKRAEEAKGAEGGKAAEEAKATKKGKAGGKRAPEPPRVAADHVLAYVGAQRDAIVGLDPAVRRDLPDSVHSMRVATRRLRSSLRSYSKVLDRTFTDPIGAELKWLAGELGVDRDQEVLTERLTAALDDLPSTLLVGPVRTRLRTWSQAGSSGSRRRLIAVLDGTRYLDLLNTLDALIAQPPLLKAAQGDPEKVLTKAVRREEGKVSTLVEQALDLPSGTDRDLAMHEARKKAKRARYAAEAAVDFDDGFKARVRASKSLQTLLGDHQDSVMAREALRDLASQAQGAGEISFTYGVLYGREERRAAEIEATLPDAYERWRTP
ncbi:CYTH and CHAD domain-containing protein [Streptomyces acidicola]|uniref:CHAD domain-containing protein n=1 Tax=Streptomyces acidicola TaxID=2596892 RepID=A0A5N8X3E8_9ACTN|nr:CYTH and CHAD domain-containing protein [Streptomyces acidicola]MPY54079.1 CHAD domain-containing protein [Streptomyces acidicola]